MGTRVNVYLSDDREAAMAAVGKGPAELIDIALAALGHPVPVHKNSPRSRPTYACCRHCKHPPNLLAHYEPCRQCPPPRSPDGTEPQ